MPTLAAVLIAAALIQSAPNPQQRSQDEVLHLMAVQGPNLHARGTVDIDSDGGRAMWWWHFYPRTPQQPDWDGTAYRVEVDCAARTTRMTRSEFFNAMRYEYGQGVSQIPQRAEAGSVRERLVQAACEDFRDGEPFSGPQEAYETAQEYFRLRAAEDESR